MCGLEVKDVTKIAVADVTLVDKRLNQAAGLVRSQTCVIGDALDAWIALACDRVLETRKLKQDKFFVGQEPMCLGNKPKTVKRH